jgi:hypothetical protein
MLELCSAVRREKATLLRRKSTNRMSFRRDAKSRFSRLTKDGQCRIAPKAPPRPGSSLLIRIIGIRSNPFRMILLHIYQNKSFAVIFLRKNRGGGGWNISPKTLSLVQGCDGLRGTGTPACALWQSPRGLWLSPAECALTNLQNLKHL